MSNVLLTTTFVEGRLVRALVRDDPREETLATVALVQGLPSRSPDHLLDIDVYRTDTGFVWTVSCPRELHVITYGTEIGLN